MNESVNSVIETCVLMQPENEFLKCLKTFPSDLVLEVVWNFSQMGNHINVNITKRTSAETVYCGT